MDFYEAVSMVIIKSCVESINNKSIELLETFYYITSNSQEIHLSRGLCLWNL